MITPAIFIDIDTQEPYIHNHSDSDGDIKRVSENLKKLTKHALQKRIKIVSLVENDEKTDSCPKKIRETAVSEKSLQIAIKEKLADPKKTWKKYHQLVIQKNGFDAFTNPNFLRLIKASRIKNIVVYGYGIDYGIEKVVVNLLSKGFKVWIPVDSVLAINELNREPVVKELHCLGVQIWNTEFILANT